MMEAITHFIGIDVSKAKLQAALLLAPDNKKMRKKSVSNSDQGFNELREWTMRQLKKCPGGCHFVMEATGVYHLDCALYLVEQGHQVSVVNPAQIKKFAQSTAARTKTDEKDASVIAKFGALMQPAPWEPPPKEYEELRRFLVRLDQLDKMLSQEKNHMESAGILGGSDDLVIQSIQDNIEALEKAKADIFKKIQDFINGNPNLKKDVELLDTIKGIGEITAMRVCAMLQGGTRFGSARQFGAWLGLTPSQHQSGSSVRGKTKLSKMGKAEYRKTFYMPAVTASRFNPDVRDLYQRLLAGGKTKMCALGGAMRKLAHIAFGVIKHQEPYAPQVKTA